MFLGRIKLFLKIGFLSALALSPLGSVGAQTAPVAKQNRLVVAKPKIISTFGLGLNYLMWNESLQISKGGVSSKGFANFAGIGVSLEKNWMRGRWFGGGSLSYAVGKVSSGGFDTGSPLSPTFADGINRAWTMSQASVYGFYRLNTTFKAGLGVLGRSIKTDWQPLDSTLTVDPEPNTKIAGQVLLRWQVARHLSLMQAYTPLNLVGSTMWTWTAILSY